MKYFIRSLPFLLLCFAPASGAAEITANTVLKRGSIITRSDISVALNAGESLETVRKEFVGQELLRTVYAGYKIEARYLGAPKLVKRNAQVNMVYKFGAMQLSAKGRALQAGAKGETISVMNVSSRKKVLAIVLGNNIVEVGQ